MKKPLLYCLPFILSWTVLLFSATLHAKSGSPLYLIENKGQITDQYGTYRSDIDFKLSTANGLNIFIGKAAIRYQWVKAGGTHTNNPAAGEDRSPAPAPFCKAPDKTPVEMYRMDVQLIGANANARITTENRTNYYERYYLPSVGENGTVANAFGKVTYHDIYPFIDWVFYFNDRGQLEHDFIVRPGGNAADIKMQYGGSNQLNVNTDGSLTAITSYGEISEQAPYVYELGSKKKVTAAFSLDKNILQFALGKYKGTLVIDPVLQWGTYFGGMDSEFINDNALGKDGKLYGTGATSSLTNIATTGAYQFTFAGGGGWLNDAFLSKFDTSGNCIWSTYYGTSEEDVSKSISCDTGGNLYIAGYTYSTTGLASGGAYQTISHGSYDAFIAKFDTSGQRVWGTYFGGQGEDGGYGPVALHCDRFNNVYLTGQTNSATGISTSGAYQSSLYAGPGDHDAFLAKFNGSGAMQWATYFGGNYGDAAYAITSDTSGNCYITGNTNSTTGIASLGQQVNAGSYDAFLAKFNPAGNKLWSTYFGGNLDDYATSIASDNASGIYITGATVSTSGLSTTGAHQTSYGGGYQDAMLARFNTSGILQWATYFGGSSEDQGDKVICAANGGIYISGFTGSDTGIIMGNALQSLLGGSYDIMLARFNPSGIQEWGSYKGGVDGDEALCIAVDNTFNIYVAGNTMSGTAIATSGAWQSAYGGGDYDAFLMRVKDCSLPAVPGAISGADTVCAGSTNSYTASSLNVTTYHWILPLGWSGSSNTSNIDVITGNGNGVLKVVAANDCGLSDTVSVSIVVNAVPVTPVIVKTGNVLSIQQTYTSYQWIKDGLPISGATNATYTIITDGIYTVKVSNASGCIATAEPVNLNVTAINEMLYKNGITIYPNPARSNVFINTPINATVSICNITGQVLQVFKISKGVNTVDLTPYVNGIYILSITNQSGILLGNQKVLKIKD